MKCAVDGNADDACTVPAFTVTDKPLVAEAANVECYTTYAHKFAHAGSWSGGGPSYTQSLGGDTTGETQPQCQAKCDANTACTLMMYRTGTNHCWLRGGTITPSQFDSNPGQDPWTLYVKQA